VCPRRVRGVHVTAPASSANMGPGFDALGLAVDLSFEAVAGDRPSERFHLAEPAHPAALGFAAAGGTGPLWWRSRIPPGRGLGFSGAAAVAGAFAAGVSVEDSCRLATQIEGHPDNAAPSAYGGFCVAAGGHVVRMDVPPGLDVLVWWPSSTTSTKRARSALPETVSFADAVHNVGRSALLVAAMAAGDIEALADAVDDRLHTSVRLALSPRSGAVLDHLRSTGVVAAWLSGSGPTVAAFVRRDSGASVLGGLEAFGGTALVLEVARAGVRSI